MTRTLRDFLLRAMKDNCNICGAFKNLQQFDFVLLKEVASLLLLVFILSLCLIKNNIFSKINAVVKNIFPASMKVNKERCSKCLKER